MLKKTKSAVLAVFLVLSMMFGLCGTAMASTLDDVVSNHVSLVTSSVKEYLEDNGYIEIINYIIENYDEAYAYAYQYAKEEGYVKEAIGYIDEAIAAVEAGKTAVAEYAVDEEFAASKDALLAEFDATVATLNKIKSLLETDALATVDGAYAEFAALGGELDEHLENIKKLSDEIGFVADAYISDVIDAVNYYAQLAEALANEAYEWAAENVENFTEEYLALVEKIGALADEVDPALGEAVRKFMIETPADALAIIYAYGEEAVIKLFADAAAAADDIYVAVSTLATVFEKYGKEIYDAVSASEECKEILNKMTKLAGQLEALAAEAAEAPAATATALYAQMDAIKADLLALAEDFYDAAIMAVKIADPVAGEALEDAMEALTEVMDIIGDYADGYDAFLADHIDAMAGELLASLIANWDEFAGVAGPIVDEIIKQLITDIDEYINTLIEDAKLQIEKLLELIENAPELEELYNTLTELVEKLEALEQQIYDGVAGIFKAEYEVSHESFYLAITEGDDSYPDIVAKALRLSVSQYKKVTMDEVTAEDIAKADLITVAYGDLDTLSFTADQLLGIANGYVTDAVEFVKAVDTKIDAKYGALISSFGIDIYETVMELVETEAGEYLGMVEGKTVAELDWAALVGEENLPYVDQLRAEIAKAVVEAGLPAEFSYSIDIVEMVAGFVAEATDNLVTVNVEDLKATLGEHAVFTLEVNVAELVTFAIESALYDFVSYNIEYSEMILNITAVNPDAVVVVLGNYNRIDVDYEIDIDEYTFTLADILALVDFDQIPAIAEFEGAIEEIVATENYDIAVPVAELVACALDEYYDAVDYVVSFDLLICDEAKAIVDEFINTANAEVEGFAGKVAETDVYTITVPFADLIALVCEYGYPIDALIDASLNTEITIGGVTVNVGDVLDVLANITSIHPFAYAVIFENVIYVDISDARVGGDEYIAEQILNALDITYNYIRGDVNGDGVVNDADAIHLLRYTFFPEEYPINQSGDMNGDYEVNDADAIYLLRYTFFPEEYPLY